MASEKKDLMDKITPIKMNAEARQQVAEVADHHQTSVSATVRMLIAKEHKRLENLAIRRAG